MSSNTNDIFDIIDALEMFINKLQRIEALERKSILYGRDGDVFIEGLWQLKQLDGLHYDRILEEISQTVRGSKGRIKDIFDDREKAKVKSTINAFTTAENLLTNKNGMPVANPFNYKQILLASTKVQLVFDTMSDDIYFSKMCWESKTKEFILNVNESERTYYRYDLTNKTGLKQTLNEFIFPTEITFSALDDAVLFVSQTNKVDFYKQWMDGYRGLWDGIDRYTQENCIAVKYLKADVCQWSATWSRLLMLSLVRRCYEPGCPLRYYFAIESAQNIGKSELCKRFVPSFWFTKGHIKEDPTNFDKSTVGMAIVEMDEEGGLDKTSINVWKSWVTDPISKYKVFYQTKEFASYLKRCIAIVTTNNWHHLNDPTGNTRCIPIRSNLPMNVFVDLEEFEREYPQILSQAIHMYDSGKLPFLNNGEMEIQTSQTTDRELVTTEYEWIEAYFDGVSGNVNNMELAKKDGVRHEFITSWLRSETAFNTDLPNDFTRHKSKMDTALRRFGFRSEVRNIEGTNQRRWWYFK